MGVSERVLRHVDLALLLSGPASMEDVAYARMIDGRTIHQFLALVLPLSRGLAGTRFADGAAQHPEPESLRYLKELIALTHRGTGNNDAVPSSLVAVASGVAALWYEADCWISRCETDEQCSSQMAQCFATSVLHEAERRVSAQSTISLPSVSEVVELLDSLPASGLSAELLAYWYPGWRRSLVIFE